MSVPIAPFSVYQGARTAISKGGTSVIALYGPLAGGKIYNPATTQDQKIQSYTTLTVVILSPLYGPLNTYGPNARPKIDGTFTKSRTATIQTFQPPKALYVSLVGPAGLQATSNTFEVLPGRSFTVPPGCKNNVWVNAVSTGHTFTAIAVQPATQFPPTPYAGAFPPHTTSALTKTIPAYLYKEYEDDDDLQSFFMSYNTMAQQYVDTFNDLNLPVYTKQGGALLDWVGQGLYDIPRPTLYSGKRHAIGPINTYGGNMLPPLGAYRNLNQVSNVTVTSDDIYKRVMTWHLYKGDGKQIGIPWLKRRLARFLNGANGSNWDGDTNQISVSMAPGSIAITLVTGIRTLTGGAFPGRFSVNSTLTNSAKSSFAAYPLLALSVILQEAIGVGALETPAQYVTTCRIGAIGRSLT
jgi:hypothetical protein